MYMNYLLAINTERFNGCRYKRETVIEKNKKIRIDIACTVGYICTYI
jgi:hypothetical protein